MAIIKNFKLGEATIEIDDSSIPKSEDELKQNLKRFYDCVNRVAYELEQRGVDTSSWFLKKTQLNKMEKSNKYVFL